MTPIREHRASTGAILGRYYAFAGVLSLILVGAVAAIGHHQWKAVLISLGIATVVVLSLLLRAASGGLSAIEPLVPASIFVAVLYVARPLREISVGSFSWVGIQLDDALVTSLAIVLALVASYLGGYWLASRSRRRQRILPVHEMNDRGVSMIAVSAVALSSIGLIAMYFQIMLAGGWSWYMLSRSVGFAGGSNIPLVSEAPRLAYVGLYVCMALPRRLRRTPWLLCASAAGIVALIAVLHGDRRYVAPLVIALLASRYVLSGRRVPVGRSVCVLVAAVLLFALPLELSRTPGSDVTYREAVEQVVLDPRAAADAVFASQSTGILNSFALAVVDIDGGALGSIGHGYGRYLLLETVLQPVPRVIFSWKPQSLRNELIAYRFGITNGACAALCPTYGPASTLWADFGILGVVLGGFVIGYSMWRWYAFCCLASRSPLRRVAYAGTLYGFAAMWWSSISALTVNFIIVAVPILVLDYVSGRSRRQAHNPSSSNDAQERTALLVGQS